MGYDLENNFFKIDFKELEELVTKMENEKEREIIIEQRFHRNIIGTKGDKIKEIRDKFNQVQISFPDAGRTWLWSLWNFNPFCEFFESRRRLTTLEEYFGLDKVYFNSLEFDVHTLLMQCFLSSGEQSDIVKIRGPKEDVDQCYNFLKRMLRELLESNYQVKVSIFRQFHKFVIGKAGSNINKVNIQVICVINFD